MSLLAAETPASSIYRRKPNQKYFQKYDPVFGKLKIYLKIIPIFLEGYFGDIFPKWRTVVLKW